MSMQESSPSSIGIAVVLAAVVFVTTAPPVRRARCRCTAGDRRSATTPLARPPAWPSRRRVATSPLSTPPRRPAPASPRRRPRRSPVDAARPRGHRRQPAHVSSTGVGLTHLGRHRCLRRRRVSLGSSGQRPPRLRPGRQRRQLDEIRDGARGTSASSNRRRAPVPGHRVPPADALSQGQHDLPGEHLPGDERLRPRYRCTRSARTRLPRSPSARRAAGSRPCHGSQYNQVGEKNGGPAPRGMDRFPTPRRPAATSPSTTHVVPGPAIGTNTTARGRGTALHHRWWRTLMLALASTAIAWVSPSHHPWLDRLRPLQRPFGAARARLRVELAPNRKPYYSDEELEGRRPGVGSSSAARSLGHRPRPAAVLGVRTSARPARPKAPIARGSSTGAAGASSRRRRPTAASTALVATAA